MKVAKRLLRGSLVDCLVISVVEVVVVVVVVE